MLKPFVYLRKFDWVLFGATALLAVFGLAVIYGTSLGAGEASTNLKLFWKQAAFVGTGLALVLVLPAFDYRLLIGAGKAAYGLAAILLVSVLVFGTTIRGTTGWFGFFGLGIQPVELVKFLLIVFLAKYFATYARDKTSWRPIIGSGMAFAVVFLLVMVQPDLGSALLLFIVWFAMLMMSGIRRKHLLVMLALFAACAMFAWMFLLKPYQKDRITSYLDADFDPRGQGYNVTQSVIAIGSGGWLGRGLGYGSQSQLRFLPERHTDFIFASAAEELGFVGVIFMLGLFAVVFHRCFVLTRKCRDDFTLFLSLGVVTSIVAELCLNIGGTTRLLPLTGVTLPFISYGGSSLLAKFLMIGTLQSVIVRNQ